jgi:hemolysin activation/secretion protein
MKKIFCVCVLFLVFAARQGYAQTAGEVQKTGRDIEMEQSIRSVLEKEKKPVEIEKPALPQEAGLESVSETKTLIKKISVTGVTLVPQYKIDEIIALYQGKELTVREMKEAADRITDAYRQRGFITSRAYLPPQKIEEGIMEVRAVEGVTGTIEITGNRFYKNLMIERNLGLISGVPFNFKTLQEGLRKLNEQPDRHAKAVLVPGKEPGATDVKVEVKDSLPLHVAFDYDNFGSRLIDQDRFRTTLMHNNLLGQGDIFSFQYQLGEGENYRLLGVRYLYPLGETFTAGFHAFRSKVDLRKESEDLHSRGKSSMYSIFLSQNIFHTENTDIELNYAFDYNDIFNFQLGNEISRDRLRMPRLGLGVDITDAYGRSIVNNDLKFGIPDMFAGLDSVDARASRDGAGGKFIKDELYLMRLQKMPWETVLLWKNHIQISPYILPASEQYQIGGIANVRGYPPAEAVGDEGYSMVWEWSFPFYFIPRDIKVPFSGSKLYDAMRFDFLYDWGHTHLHRPSAGEEKHKTLRSTGFGLRFNLPENFSCRIDFSWPLDNMPSDNQRMHQWIEISTLF